MNLSSDIQKLEKTLRSSDVVSGGFLGADARTLAEIIAEDLATLTRLDRAPAQLARRMQELTDAAKPGLGTPVALGNHFVVCCEEWKGLVVCPWPDCGRFDKRITTTRRLDTRRTIRWTDLNIHLIAEHCFFEGHGAAFRLEPEDLVSILF